MTLIDNPMLTISNFLGISYVLLLTKLTASSLVWFSLSKTTVLRVYLTSKKAYSSEEKDFALTSHMLIDIYQ